MPNPYFSFKQFTVYHDRCAMKVGIDGVLLGVWADVQNATNILDIGTGSGLIALMLAQRSDVSVTGIDIDADAVLQANQNISRSPWSGRVRAIQVPLQKFIGEGTFDLIVSNPPYFVNSLKASGAGCSQARHTDMLPHQELILHANRLLTVDGKFCVILPVKEGLDCIEQAMKHGLFCSRKINVIPRPNAEPKRLLLEFRRGAGDPETSDLLIETERHRYSPEFTELAMDFYLKL